jgi:hypothetical protein
MVLFLPSAIGVSYAQTEMRLSKGQTVYVPIYSHIYFGDKETRFWLAVTVSIRNTDPQYPMTILEGEYYDSAGRLIKKYVEKPIRINARSSERFIIKESDDTGGSGASFILKWRSERPISTPIIESVMIGTRSQQGISFTSRGQVVREEDR